MRCSASARRRRRCARRWPSTSAAATTARTRRRSVRWRSRPAPTSWRATASCASLAHLLAAAQPAPAAGPHPARRDCCARRSRPCAAPPPQQAVDEGARLLGAEWALDDRDAPRARSLLAELPPGVARRTQALRLKLQAARLRATPREALHTARLLAKHQAFSPIAAQGLLRSLALRAIDSAHDADQLRRAGARSTRPIAATRSSPRAPRARAAALGAAADGRAVAAAVLEQPARAQRRRARTGRAGAGGGLRRHRHRLAAAARGGAAGLSGTRRRCKPPRARCSPSAGCGARRAGCSKQAAADRHLDPAARRSAWRTLARLAREEVRRGARAALRASGRGDRLRPRPAGILPARAAVAQLDRVLGYEPRGRGFESCQPRQMNQRVSFLRLTRLSFLSCSLAMVPVHAGGEHHAGTERGSTRLGPICGARCSRSVAR